MGLEPTNGGTTIHCLNHLATLAISIYNYSTLFQIDLPPGKNFFDFV